MFLVVRSVFWLTVAYMVIKPGVDFADAQAMSAQAMAAGQQVIAEQIQAIECDSFQCVGGKAIAAAALQPSRRDSGSPAPGPGFRPQGSRHFPKRRTPAIPGLSPKHAAPCLGLFLCGRHCLAIDTNCAYIDGIRLSYMAI
jgi:hypothetical protein